MGDLASRLADPQHVEAQYRDAGRLDARTVLYERFSEPGEPWYRWLFARLAPAAGSRVLDAGCGTGGVWGANTDRVPGDLELVLVDRSEGMLDEARARLAPVAPEARCADLRALPFEDASFDLVTCNHVLYHVADPEAAIRELVRVCLPEGRVSIATNDWTHLQELRELLHRFGVEGVFRGVGRDMGTFDVEAAAFALGAALGRVAVHRRRDVLRVTEVGPLRDYVRSVLAQGEDGEPGLSRALAHVERVIATTGAFEAIACAGVVIGRRGAAP